MRRSFARRAAAALATLAIGFLFMAASAEAQQAQRLHGVVTRLDGEKLILRGDNGQPVTVLLAPDARITSIVPAKLSDIKPGRFVGTAARPSRMIAGGRSKFISSRSGRGLAKATTLGSRNPVRP